MITLIPLQRGDFLSDGARLLRGLRSHALARWDLAIATLLGLSLGPNRPRNWSAALLDEVAYANEEVSPTAAYLRYLYALDTGRWSEARGHLQQALWVAQPGTPLAAELALEAAFFEVAIRCDAQRAQRWLEPACRTLDRGFLQAVQAAVARDKPAATRAVQRLASRSGVDALRAEKLQESLSRCPPSP